MKLNYYVLGKNNNEIVITYFDKYYVLLISHLIKLSQVGILSPEINKLLKIQNKDFLLNPDYSSIIHILYKEVIEKKHQNLGERKIFENKFKKEINIFLSEGIESENLTMNKGEKIYGTNIKLTIEDNNPYNTMEAHPEHHLNGGKLGWGEKSQEDWLQIYEKTFELLKKIDPEFYSELNQIIKKIIPLGTAKGLHNSASYKECIGHLYLGYTIDSLHPEINNLEAIIHESSHNKLNLIKQFDPILLNDYSEKYYSAIRPDARHIHGVFIGYHAFAPTMYMIMKAYLHGFLGDDIQWFEKIVLYYIKTKFLQKIVKKYAILTDIGKEISEEIDYVIMQMDILIKEMNPSKEMIQKATEKQKEHFSEVNNKYPYLQY